jgi:transcriptional regulator with XRE-family HTH domain
MAGRKLGVPMRRAGKRSDADWHVCARMRDRRAELGLTQQQMGELIGVSYQQAPKYETGINRIPAGRLLVIANALGVGVGYFFEGLARECAAEPNAQHRLLLELTRDFAAIPNRKVQEALCAVARALAAVEPEAENGARPAKAS